SLLRTVPAGPRPGARPCYGSVTSSSRPTPFAPSEPDNRTQANQTIALLSALQSCDVHVVGPGPRLWTKRNGAGEGAVSSTWGGEVGTGGIGRARCLPES